MQVTDQLLIKKENNYKTYKIYIYFLVIITIIITLTRIIYLLNDTLPFASIKDDDYIILYEIHVQGLNNYYISHSGAFYQQYLYYWYFISYPFFLLPLEIGMYVWDVLRLTTVIYITSNIYKINKNSKNLPLFLFLNGLGYVADSFLNNTNWILYILLYLSYISLEKDKKIVSGLLFTVAMYKFTVIAFPFVLLITKKIKVKELIYYILPLLIFLIPYVIYPDYLYQMVTNWTLKSNNHPNILLQIFNILWLIFQHAQLLFISFLLLLFLNNISKEKWKKSIRIFVVLVMIIFNIGMIITWIIIS